MSKHTPGTWEIKEIKNDGCYGSGLNTHSGFFSFAIVNEKDETIVDTLNSTVSSINDYDFESPTDETGIANAKLISAAPDLLDALIHLLNLPIDCSQEADRAAWSKAIKAINKAKGQS